MVMAYIKCSFPRVLVSILLLTFHAGKFTVPIVLSVKLSAVVAADSGVISFPVIPNTTLVDA